MVVSGASSSARAGHGIDRFYNPPAVRRQLQQQQQQQQQQLQQEQRPKNRQRSPQKATRTKPRPQPAAAPRETSPVTVDEVRVESDDSSSKSAVTSSSNSNSSSLPSLTRPPTPAGNLDRFLESTTPVVPARYRRRKTTVRGWRSSDTVDSCPYFDLGDLWESFREWSAYGAGVPLVLNGNDAIVQYYAPYLSGIQLYVDASKRALKLRQRGEESDGEPYQDTSSDASSSSGSHAGQEGPFVNNRDGCNQATRPIFEYMASDTPYAREPLVDKISELANKFPSLKTYKSFELSPSSWMCVAWYPIYRIPTGHTLKDLDACFLTFHSLSAPLNNPTNGHTLCNGGSNILRSANSASQMSAKIPVPVFGLASYKLTGSIWTANGQYEQQQANSLLQAAHNWVRLLNVEHPDFQFFLSRYTVPWR